MVKLFGCPEQPAADIGVTVMVAIMDEAVVLVAVNDGMLPVPEAASPMSGLLFVHVLIAAFTLLPLNVIAGCTLPVQSTLLAMLFNTGSAAVLTS